MGDRQPPAVAPAPADLDSLLSVRSLTVRYRSAGRPVEAVRDVDLGLGSGEAVGVLGESGSGKSTLAVAIAGLLPANAELVSGGVAFAQRELLELDDASLDRLRGDRLSIVFQQPGLSLNPVLRVGGQIADVLRAHRAVSPRAARHRALELLDMVRFEEPQAIFSAYPHELSGGQQQRVAIAQALICEPDLLIADEPTAALDSVTQAELIDLLRRLRRELDMALLFVSHDPALLSGLADRLLVMYAGRVVESGPTEALLTRPLHPYPAELLRCVPAPPAAGLERATRLHTIPGAPPRLDPAPPGCAFEPRCPRRLERCAEELPELVSRASLHTVACWNDRTAEETEGSS
jgi:oligopeptide/dipeptide ABC transporter ATP-binding protein